MTHALPLYLMVPGSSLEGTVLTKEAPPDGEVAQHMKGAMEPVKDAEGAVIAIA